MACYITYSRAKCYFILFRTMGDNHHLTTFQNLQLRARNKFAISTQGVGHCMLDAVYHGLSFDCGLGVSFPDYLISFFNTFRDYCREGINQGLFDPDEVSLEGLIEQVHRFVFHYNYDADIVDHAVLVLCNEFLCKIDVIVEKFPVRSCVPAKEQPLAVSHDSYNVQLHVVLTRLTVIFHTNIAGQRDNLGKDWESL